MGVGCLFFFSDQLLPGMTFSTIGRPGTTFMQSSISLTLRCTAAWEGSGSVLRNSLTIVFMHL